MKCRNVYHITNNMAWREEAWFWRSCTQYFTGKPLYLISWEMVRRREGGGWGFPAPPLPSTLNLKGHKSNMAGGINDHEFVTLTLPNETPALQAVTNTWSSHTCIRLNKGNVNNSGARELLFYNPTRSSWIHISLLSVGLIKIPTWLGKHFELIFFHTDWNCFSLSKLNMLSHLQ